MDNHHILGVVGKEYRLVTNQDAFDFAHECCREVFPETKPSEWEASTVDAPLTRSYCHIDLVHKTSALEFDYRMKGERPEVPDAFGPFIRVTNSYNGKYALKFSIGFYRKACKNGMVVPDAIIEFSFDHIRKDIKDGIKFNVDHARLAKAKEDFLGYFQVLRDCTIDRSQFNSLILGVLLLKEPKKGTKEATGAAMKREEDWVELQKDLESINERYIEQQGENAYAALNSITELASHPRKYPYIRRDRNSMQKLAGEWLTSFSQQCRKSGFSIKEYLATLTPESDSKMSESFGMGA